ncbi:MAG: hypothetical protein R3C49_14640 [Planctomycetaceae bacterium]
MKGSGGTDGGLGQFLIGFGLAALAVYLFFDSVRVITTGTGLVSGMLRGRGGHGQMGDTTSMGILFVPFFLGVFSLFVNARQRWAWVLTYFGIAVLAVEVISQIRFFVDMKLIHLLLMLILFAAGCALMFRSYDEDTPEALNQLSRTSDDGDPGSGVQTEATPSPQTAAPTSGGEART